MEQQEVTVMTLHDLDRSAQTHVGSPGAFAARVRIAVLWLVVGGALAGSMAVFYAEPGRLEEGVAGTMEGEPVTSASAYLFAALVGLPLVMAAITVFVTSRPGAIANLVVGGILGAFGVYAFTAEVSGGSLAPHVTLALLAAASAWVVAGLSVAELRHSLGE